MRGLVRLSLLTIGSMLLATGTMAQEAAELTQPEGWSLAGEERSALIARGAELFADASIGETGSSCMTCHAEFENYNDTFLEPYPHFVAMGANMFDMDQVTAAEMVQLCMVVPMGTEAWPWDSEELRALTAYVEDERERFAAR